MVFEYSSGVRSIADELLYRERQFPFDSLRLLSVGRQAQDGRSSAPEDKLRMA